MNKGDTKPLERTHARFEDTRWSLIDGLRRDDAAVRERAATELARQYWPAIYGYLRRSGRGREESTEITQAFFAEVILARGLFERADASKGHLRSLVVSSLKRYVIDQARAGESQVSRRVWSLQDGDAEAEDASHPASKANQGESPESFFDRRWAIAQLEEALCRCETHFRDTGKPRHWELFAARVLRPAIHLSRPPHLAEVALVLGYPTAADGAAAVQVVRKRLLAYLDQVVAECRTDSGQDPGGSREILAALGL